MCKPSLPGAVLLTLYIYIFVISSRLQPDQKRIKKESNVTEELVPNSSGSNVGGASSKGWYYTLIMCHSELVNADHFLFLKVLSFATL